MSTRRERAKAQNAQQSSANQAVAAVVKPVKEHPIAKKMGDFFIVSNRK